MQLVGHTGSVRLANTPLQLPPRDVGSSHGDDTLLNVESVTKLMAEDFPRHFRLRNVNTVGSQRLLKPIHLGEKRPWVRIWFHSHGVERPFKEL